MKPVHTHHSVDCSPVKDLLARIAGKWTVLIVIRLSDGPMRFSELKRGIAGISQKMLTSTLRDLEQDGFVARVVTPTIPPRVDYALTELGRDLLGPLHILGTWAIANRHRVEAARMAHRRADA